MKNWMKVAVLAAPLAFGGAFAPGAANAAICGTSDVSLMIGGTNYVASSCADGLAPGNPTVQTAEMGTNLGITGLIYLDKSDDASNPAGLGGISFVVEADNGETSGSWSVTWFEQPGSPDLPIVIDFAVGLFGGANGASYLFKDVLLPVTPNTGTGTFAITFLNPGGNNPELSHLILAGTNVRTPVPTPAGLAIFGVALAGLGLALRRRQA